MKPHSLSEHLVACLLTFVLMPFAAAQFSGHQDKSRTASITDLGSLGGDGSIGSDIDASGQVTGLSYTSTFQLHAFLYNSRSGMVDLGTLTEDSYSYGRGINASGQVTGVSFRSDSQYHAFLYSSRTGMVDLGTLGGTTSVANGINDYGQVTGFSYTSSGATHAFLYAPGDGMVDLNAMRSIGSGWTLSVAYAINNAGEITGLGTNPSGATHAFLLRLHRPDIVSRPSN